VKYHSQQGWQIIMQIESVNFRVYKLDLFEDIWLKNWKLELSQLQAAVRGMTREWIREDGCVANQEPIGIEVDEDTVSKCTESRSSRVL
jgi:hypothetical protein